MNLTTVFKIGSRCLPEIVGFHALRGLVERGSSARFLGSVIYDMKMQRTPNGQVYPLKICESVAVSQKGVVQDLGFIRKFPSMPKA